MKIVDSFAVGFEDYNVEVTVDKDFNIVKAVALENIDEELVRVKKGGIIKNCDDFDYEFMSECLRENLKL